MGNRLKAGTKNPQRPTVGDETIDDGLNTYAKSMAEAMEKAFMEEWPIIMETDKPEMNSHLQLMFISVAQGVVRHLFDNISAIKVDIPRVSGSGLTITTEEKSLKKVEVSGKLY